MNNKFLEELVSKHSEELLKWAFHKTSSISMAEDLVQDSFLAAAEKISSFKKESSAKTWIFSILNHKIIDFYRNRASQHISLENDYLSAFFDEDGSWLQEKLPKQWQDEESHLLDNKDFQAILEKCMDALPPKWNTCVKLKYLSEKKGQEICQEIGISPTNFWQVVHRAKLQLRDCIEKKWNQDN